ncbi:UNVERIFIED_CONTAM: hypothetical protein GTU68_059530 [Idotea baltica]|nr:hypothetical protein [Idotea baltica]
MSKSSILYSQRVWINNKLQAASLVISAGKISEITIGEKLSNAHDYGDAVIMPGVMDAHAHINEPGRTEWEGFETATQAAAAGGTTTVVDMPLNSSPVTISLSAFEDKLAASKDKMHVNCGFYAGLVPQNAASPELEKLIDAGVLGVKAFLVHSGIDEFPNVSKEDIEQAMPLLAKLQIPFLAHCELEYPQDNSAFEQAPTNYQLYLQSRPQKWEMDAIDQMIEICETHNSPVHIVHLSAAAGLESIAHAKSKKIPLTVETCPHYIFFDAESIPDGQTIYKCAPPIREKENNARLKLALKEGLIDFISTDHSPAPPNIKELDSGNYLKAWGGIAGIQFLLNAAWTSLKNDVSLHDFIPLLTSNVAQFLGVDNRKGKIAEGMDADLVIWQPEQHFVVRQKQLLFKHKISPYLNQTLFGKVEQTFVNGILVFDQGKIIQKNKGQWLLRK